MRIGAHVPIAIYLGRGTVRAWPPDGIEHQQMRKLLDEDFLEEEFERLVFWTTGDVGARLAALASGPPGRRAGRAADLLEDRREELLERQLANPDSRVLMALWRAEADPPLGPPPRPYVYADIDGREHDWFAFQIEPRDPEEVQLARFRRRHERTEVWMSTDVLTDFDAARAPSLAVGGPRATRSGRVRRAPAATATTSGASGTSGCRCVPHGPMPKAGRRVSRSPAPTSTWRSRATATPPAAWRSSWSRSCRSPRSGCASRPRWR